GGARALDQGAFVAEREREGAAAQRERRGVVGVDAPPWGRGEVAQAALDELAVEEARRRGGAAGDDADGHAVGGGAQGERAAGGALGAGGGVGPAPDRGDDGAAGGELDPGAVRLDQAPEVRQ